MRVIKIPADIEQEMVELDVPSEFPAINLSLLGDTKANLENVYVKGLRKLAKPTQMMALLVDEDGLSKELPLNVRASLLYGSHVHGAPIVGNAYVVASTIEDWVSVPKTIGIGQIQAAINEARENPGMFA